MRCKQYMRFELIIVAMFVAAAFLAGGCASLREKSVAAAGTVSAVKIEAAGGSSTGTPLPNVLMGGAAFAFADSPDSDRRVMFVRAARSSVLSKIFGLGLDDSATIYIGSPDETAAETEARVKALSAASSVAP